MPENFEPKPVDVEDRPPQGESPPKADPPKAEAPKPKRPTPADRKLREALTGFYGSLGLLVIATSSGDVQVQAAGNHIAGQAEAAADAWMDLAQQNPAVKRALQRFTEGTAFAGVLAVHVSMLLPLAAAKGMIPEQYQAAVMVMANGPMTNGASG